MTDLNSPLRIRDIPSEQAASLHCIHELAARETLLRQAMRASSPRSADGARILDQICEVSRNRDLTEIAARGGGVPGSWVDQARAAGQSGRAWTDELLLMAPHPRASRRNTKRVLDDTRQMADMAAITIARENCLATYGVTAEPEPAAAGQLRRNMEAMWTRAAATATSIGMGRNERARLFHAASSDVERRVETYLHYSLDDLNAQWRSYTTPTIAASVRRSLGSLRRAGRRADITTADSDAEQPPRPKILIERARDALNPAGARGSQVGTDIAAAVTAAIPDAMAHGWDMSAEVHGGHSAAEMYPDVGPDP
ncbi:hypothetical protein AB0B25_07960 [Nocardia sp. NPDC049190]|uniref:hypothetical protein n=1 Tax=Nocardia sp. NPDC049190 TaxID=3155650 RepID=UPI0033ED3667